MTQPVEIIESHFKKVVEEYKSLEKLNESQWLLLNKIGGCTNMKQVKKLLDLHYQL
jgi:hypothetical protein